MFRDNELFEKNNKDEIWQRYCGFLDLSISEFMDIQQNLLFDEIELVSKSPLGKKIMKGRKPKTVEEFRKFVPLTTYDDYATYIGNCQEDALAEKPVCWCRTSGRVSGPKWVPLTRKAYERSGIFGIMVLILACASKKGEVRVGKGTRFMQNLPSRPYITGTGTTATLERLQVHMLPPFEESEKMSFEEKIQTGFKTALREGVDVIGSMTSIMVKMGERFTEGSQSMKLSFNMLHPRILFRLILAVLRAKAEKRPIMPKDLWPVKGLICYGTDTSIYRNDIIRYWGKEPLELYGSTEAISIATKSWDKNKDMTFIPFFSFLEFIPEEEWLKGRQNNDYQPSTVLLNQLEKGKRYELVVTNFYGMPFLRYRQGDLIRIIDLKDDELGIQIPQMRFDSRADDLIDIGGFTRLDEKTVWQAINNAGIKYEDWAARKEYELDKPVLRIYLESKEEIDKNESERRIHNELVAIDVEYSNLERMLGIKPLRLTLLPKGSFQHYFEEKRKAGADLSHLKPAHMNASDQVIKDLLYHSAVGAER